jgi:hypothetical protein
MATKSAAIGVIKFKLCNTLLHVLLVRIGSYVKSVPRYKFLVLDNYHPDTLHLCEQGCEGSFLLSNPKGVREQKVSETQL